MNAIDGRKAEIINKEVRYSSYVTFARQFGHPEAAVGFADEDKRKPLRNGDVVTLIVCGDHLAFPLEGSLWIVEAANGEKHIINEKGLRILDEKVTVLKDELGLDREYREVKREASDGERIKVIAISPDSGKNGKVEIGEVFTVKYVDEVGDVLSVEERCVGGLFATDWKGLREYVVLEPTDIVRIDGERFRMVDRKASVGERVVVVDVVDDAHEFPLGSIGVVEWISDLGYEVRVSNLHYKQTLIQDEYRVLVPVQALAHEPLGSVSDAAQPNVSEQAGVADLVRKSHEQQARIDGLTETVANLARRLSEAESALHNVGLDVGLIENGVSEDIRKLKERVAELERGQAPKEAPEPVVEKTSTRDEVIEKARVDVADLKRIGGDRYATLPPTSSLCGKYYDVKFQINRKKNTVVALVYGGISRTLYSRGIAKCAPTDCFNVHIGTAIALRRALGLDIPQEYVNTPQPTEVKVGDVVTKTEGYDAGVSGVVEQIGGDRNPRKPAWIYVGGDQGLTFFDESDTHFWAFKHRVKILDDSRDGRYGEVYSA